MSPEKEIVIGGQSSTVQDSVDKKIAEFDKSLQANYKTIREMSADKLKENIEKVNVAYAVAITTTGNEATLRRKLRDHFRSIRNELVKRLTEEVTPYPDQQELNPVDGAIEDLQNKHTKRQNIKGMEVTGPLGRRICAKATALSHPQWDRATRTRYNQALKRIMKKGWNFQSERAMDYMKKKGFTPIEPKKKKESDEQSG